MVKMLLAALVLTAITVVIHGVGTSASTRRVARLWAGRKSRPGRLATELVMTRLVSFLLLLHVVEALVWAIFYVLIGALPDPASAAYFSLTSYTTVGYGDIVLPEPWRLLGPLEASAGVLMFGWSTGTLVAVIGTIYRRDFGPLTGQGRT